VVTTGRSIAREVVLPTYVVTIGAGVIENLGEIVRGSAGAHRYAIITDENVGQMYATGASAALRIPASAIFTMPAGEQFKTRETWARLTDELLAAGFGRDTTIIAIGGGVVGDLGGFVAATFMRGVRYVQVPTSLLAMIDASVGGKTGVDTATGKNLVGAFHQPAAVIADTSVLASLPIEQFRAGMAEAIKHGVIADEDYFSRVESLAGTLQSIDVSSPAVLDLVARSVEIKADVVRRDEREDGIRKTLNFGHTVGHAIELASGYTLLHGEAVAIGMVYEALIAERIGAATPGTADSIRRAVKAAELPDTRPSSISIDDVVSATRGDKKARAGRTEYALPARIGAMAGASRSWSMPVSEDLLREVLG
jgi:3-dehydroquinate synthase